MPALQNLLCPRIMQEFTGIWLTDFLNSAVKIIFEYFLFFVFRFLFFSIAHILPADNLHFISKFSFKIHLCLNRRTLNLMRSNSPILNFVSGYSEKNSFLIMNSSFNESPMGNLNEVSKSTYHCENTTSKTQPSPICTGHTGISGKKIISKIIIMNSSGSAIDSKWLILDIFC